MGGVKIGRYEDILAVVILTSMAIIFGAIALGLLGAMLLALIR